MTIDGGVVDSPIDLSGERQNNLQGKINIEVGQMTLLLLKQTGVKVNIIKGLAKLETNDFTALDNNVYGNDAYGSSDTTIEMDLTISVGTLKIELVE